MKTTQTNYSQGKFVCAIGHLLLCSHDSLNSIASGIHTTVSLLNVPTSPLSNKQSNRLCKDKKTSYNVLTSEYEQSSGYTERIVPSVLESTTANSLSFFFFYKLLRLSCVQACTRAHTMLHCYSPA